MNREIGIWNITMDRWVIDDRSMIPDDIFRTTHFHKAVTAINQMRHLEMAFKMAMKRRSCSFELRYLDNNEPVNESKGGKIISR